LWGSSPPFNFPVAVYAWNTSLALIAGDTVVWKPAEGTRLAAIAVNELLRQAVKDSGAAAIHRLVLADRSRASVSWRTRMVALIFATGLVAMGRAIAR
jgi:L-aminoadipate-semialdehyde dehydrogenase